VAKVVELLASPIPGCRAVELTSSDEARLQRFFEANPAYFLAVNGEPAGPQAAHEVIHDELPAGWPYGRLWLFGFVDDSGDLAAMASVVSDLLAQGVWHIGLFIVASARHSSGDARLLYDGLERWAATHGARWMRLGVVLGNTRAERFWQSLGYEQTRTREGVAMGRLVNTVRVMVKPLGDNSVAQFLTLVERDRPTAT
jgi:GNAT superfamily N-acetyltransferase